MDVTKIVCDGFIKYIKENNITGDDIAFELMDVSGIIKTTNSGGIRFTNFGEC